MDIKTKHVAWVVGYLVVAFAVLPPLLNAQSDILNAGGFVLLVALVVVLIKTVIKVIKTYEEQ